MEKIHRPTKRVIDILLSVCQKQEGLSFTEISRETNIPKGTLSPILQTLVNEKMLYLNEYTMRYKIGSIAFSIGYSFVEDIDLMDTIKQKMKEIVDRCDEICQLGVLDGSNVLYLAKVEPEQSIKLESSVGRSLPAYATSLGKCLLSTHSDDEIEKLFENGLDKLTKNTIDNMDDLLNEVDKVRKEGIAYEWGESNDQVMCMSVPINNREKTVLALSVSVPIYRAEDEKLKEIEMILKDVKNSIEKKVNILNVSDLGKI